MLPDGSPDDRVWHRTGALGAVGSDAAWGLRDRCTHDLSESSGTRHFWPLYAMFWQVNRILTCHEPPRGAHRLVGCKVTRGGLGDSKEAPLTTLRARRYTNVVGARRSQWLVITFALSACTSRGAGPPSEVVSTSSSTVGSASPSRAGLRTDQGAEAKLFTADVPRDSLPLSIAIETLGGVSSILIPRGTRLPATHTETFSTAADDQVSVEIHVLQGERPLARDNRSLGKFQLTGIPPASRGVPQIEVTFATDKVGVLAVSARDLATGANRKVVIGSSGAELDQKTIDRMLAEAAAAQVTDDNARELVNTRNELDTLIRRVRKLLVDSGGKVPEELRAPCEHALRDAERSLTSNDVGMLRDASAKLQATTHAVTDVSYLP